MPGSCLTVIPSMPAAPLLRTTASNAASILSGSQIASMRCSVDAGLSRSADAVTASTSCVSRRGASPRPGIGKSNSSWYGGRDAVMRRPINLPFPSTPYRGPFGPSAGTPACRVGGGALDCSRADLRPPPKLDVQFSRIQLSRRRCPLSSDGRDQRDKIDKPELAVELAGWQRCPTAAAPFPEPVRPDSSHQPAVESVEELSDVGPLVVMAPTTHNGVRLFYQLLSGHRSVAPREPANLILEVADRFLPRVRIQSSRLGTSLDLARRQPHGPAASLDLVPEELEAIPDVHDPRLLRIDVHAQLLQDSTRRHQCGACFGCGRAGDNPIVRIPRELIAPASHLPIERGQKNVAQQRRGYPALRRPSFRREEPTRSVTA